MKTSDRDVDLAPFFPFSRIDASLREKALTLGKCVEYKSGEPVLLSGSPAKHCGLILEGQAVAFKMDSTGRRYQLCLEEGCFIGLETLRADSAYTAKIVALTDLAVFFWNTDGIFRLTDRDPDFAEAMRMLDDGRTYQEQWLIPETDITDPVLCSIQRYWMSVIAPAFLILPLLLILLSACAMLIHRYRVAWLLVLALLARAGSLLYRQITGRLNERVIVTSKNLILLPRSSDEEQTVIRLYGLQALAVERNIFQRLIDVGQIRLVMPESECLTPLIHNPVQAASLVQSFAERISRGGTVPLRIGGKTVHTLPPRAEDPDPAPVSAPVSAPDPEKPSAPSVPVFHRAEFHAHWALLIRMILFPLLVTAAAFCAMYFFRNSINSDFIRAELFLIAGIAAISLILKIFEWRNNRFSIEEDSVRDYTKKPFSGEELHIAMIHKIQSVRYEKSGFFQVLLNYGTVYILAGEGELTFDYVSNPRKVQQLIMDACAQYEAKSKMEEEARRRAYISELVSEIHHEVAP